MLSSTPNGSDQLSQRVTSIRKMEIGESEDSCAANDSLVWYFLNIDTSDPGALAGWK